MAAKPLSDDLYVLQFLAGEQYDEDSTACEYRFLSSGFISAGDPRSAQGRFLLMRPFEWVVASEEWKRVPEDQWPQESIVRFQVNSVVRAIGQRIYIYPADDELAHDLAALLSLLCRRLITVVGCTSQRNFDEGKKDKPVLELPFPVFNRLNLRYWPLQPHVLVRRPEEAEATAIDYNPYPKYIKRDELGGLLAALPRLKSAKSLVLAARLYAEGLAVVHQAPDMAYLLITMAIETAASQAIDGSKTDDQIWQSIPERFRTLMISLGATEQVIREASAVAVPQHGRPTYQFSAFAEQFHTEELFGKDDLFRMESHQEWLPTKDKVKQAAQRIYSQRSKFVHEGKPYPASIAVGLSAKVDNRAFQVDTNKGPTIPPLAWAERLAHVCIVNYWRKEAIELSKQSDQS